MFSFDIVSSVQCLSIPDVVSAVNCIVRLIGEIKAWGMTEDVGVRYDVVNHRTTNTHHQPQHYLHHSPHLLDLLHFLQDVGSDHSDHHLDSGQDRQDGHPDDLVVLEPVQQVVHTGGLLHPPGRVLILLPANKKSINDLFIISTVQSVVYPHESQGFSKPKEIVIKR